MISGSGRECEMREIKFRYRLKDRINGKTRIEMFTLEEIEIDVFEWLDRWEILSRDLSTGLHDKNGKEIWEGDLLRSEIMKTLLIPVKWYSESAGFHLAWIEGHNVEVIGNIYENPELLKE